MPAPPIQIAVTANANPLYDEIIRQARRAEAAVKKIPLRIETKDLGGFKTLTADIDRFDKSVSRMSAVITTFGQAAAIIFGIQNAFAAMVKTSVKVEKQLNDINAIFGASNKTMKQFSDGLFDVAKQTGQSFDVAATAAQEFARQGLSVEQTLKRTRDALTLTRISGLDAANATESLTAILNTFKKEALDSTRVTNVLANVDTKFAVSAADLTEALKRAGASAADARVPFNELVAAVTSLQQSTARGGSVIGNSLKSIFTRVQRGDTIDALRSIGVEVRDAEGKTRPMLDTLKKLAVEFRTLGDATRSSIKEQVAGVYQINQLSALLADLSSGYSTYDKALRVANNTQNEATDRLEVLKNVTAGSLNDTLANLTKFAAESGKIVINPIIKTGSDLFNSLFDKSDGISEGEAFGQKVGEGLLKGLGSLLTSGGGVIIAKALFNISRLVAVGVKDQVIAATTLNRTSEKKLFLQERYKEVLLSSNPIYQSIIKSATTEEGKRRAILNILREQEASLLRINSLASKFASQTLKEGVTSFSAVNNAPRKLFGRAAGGLLPSMIAEKQAVNSGVGGAPRSARPVAIPNFNLGGGKKETIIANSSEYIVPNYANGGSAIFNQDMIKSMGLPKGAKKIMAGGYVPNFRTNKEIQLFRGVYDSKTNHDHNKPLDPSLFSTAGHAKYVVDRQRAMDQRYQSSLYNKRGVFAKTFLNSTSVDDIVTLLSHHTGTSIPGLVSYSKNKGVSTGFAGLTSDERGKSQVNSILFPVTQIISSRRKLGKILKLPKKEKAKLLKSGIGLNIPRLESEKSLINSYEKEIAIFTGNQKNLIEKFALAPALAGGYTPVRSRPFNLKSDARTQKKFLSLEAKRMGMSVDEMFQSRPELFKAFAIEHRMRFPRSKKDEMDSMLEQFGFASGYIPNFVFGGRGARNFTEEFYSPLDNKARFTIKPPDSLFKSKLKGKSISDILGKKSKYLSDAIDFDDLFNNYPQLADLDLARLSGKSTSRGVFIAGQGGELGKSLGLGSKIGLNPNLDRKTGESTLIHEIQHAIQNEEGSFLGDEKLYKKFQSGKLSISKYRNIPSEVESVSAQALFEKKFPGLPSAVLQSIVKGQLKGRGFAGGYIPNFNPLLASAQREAASLSELGYSKEQIFKSLKVQSSPRLKNKDNPNGLGLFNTLQGQNTIGQALSDHAGENIHKSGIPNFASPKETLSKLLRTLNSPFDPTQKSLLTTPVTGQKTVKDISKSGSLFNRYASDLVRLTQARIKQIDQQLKTSSLDDKVTKQLVENKKYYSNVLNKTLDISGKKEKLTRDPIIQSALIERNNAEGVLQRQGVLPKLNSKGKAIEYDEDAQVVATRQNKKRKILRGRQEEKLDLQTKEGNSILAARTDRLRSEQQQKMEEGNARLAAAVDRKNREQELFNQTVADRKQKREAEQARKKEYTGKKVNEASRRNRARDLAEKRALSKIDRGVFTEDYAIQKGYLSGGEVKRRKASNAEALKQKLKDEQEDRDLKKEQKRQGRREFGTQALLATSFISPFISEGLISAFGDGNEKNPNSRFASGATNSISTGLALATLGPLGVIAGTGAAIGGSASAFVKSRNEFGGQELTTQELQKTIDSNQRQTNKSAEFFDLFQRFADSSGFEKTLAKEGLRKNLSSFEDKNLATKLTNVSFDPSKSFDDIIRSQRDIFGQDESSRDVKENKAATREFFAQIVDGTGFFTRLNKQVEFAPQKVGKFVDLLSNNVSPQDLKGTKITDEFVKKLIQDTGLDLGKFAGNASIDSIQGLTKIDLQRRQSQGVFFDTQNEISKRTGSVRTETLEKGKNLLERTSLIGELTRRSLFETAAAKLESPVFSEEAKTQASFGLKELEVTSKLVSSISDLGNQFGTIVNKDSGITGSKKYDLTALLASGNVAQDPLAILKSFEDFKGLSQEEGESQRELVATAKKQLEAAKVELSLIRDLKDIQAKNAQQKAILEYFNKSGLKGSENIGRSAIRKSGDVTSAELAFKEAQRLSSDAPNKQQRVFEARGNLARARIAKFEEEKGRGLGPSDNIGRASAISRLTPEIKEVARSNLFSDLFGAINSIKSSNIGSSIESSIARFEKIAQTGDVSKLPTELSRLEKNATISLRQGSVPSAQTEPVLNSFIQTLKQLTDKLNPANLDAAASTEASRLVGGDLSTVTEFDKLSQVLNPTTSVLLASTLTFEKSAKELSESLKKYKLETEKLQADEAKNKADSDQASKDKFNRDRILDATKLVSDVELFVNSFKDTSVSSNDIRNSLQSQTSAIFPGVYQVPQIPINSNLGRVDQISDFMGGGRDNIPNAPTELLTSLNSLKEELSRLGITFEEFRKLSKEDQIKKISTPANFDPYASAIRRAKNKEIGAGIPANQIYTDTDKRLISPTNPMGLMVANYLDEPNGGFEGVDRKIKRGLNPKLNESGIPNFAEKKYDPLSEVRDVRLKYALLGLKSGKDANYNAYLSNKNPSFFDYLDPEFGNEVSRYANNTNEFTISALDRYFESEREVDEQDYKEMSARKLRQEAMMRYPAPGTLIGPTTNQQMVEAKERIKLRESNLSEVPYGPEMRDMSDIMLEISQRKNNILNKPIDPSYFDSQTMEKFRKDRDRMKEYSSNNAKLRESGKFFSDSETEQQKIFRELKERKAATGRFDANGKFNFEQKKAIQKTSSGSLPAKGTNATPNANASMPSESIAELKNLVSKLGDVGVKIQNESTRSLRLDINGTSASVKDLQEMETRIMDKVVAIIEKNRRAMGERSLVMTT